MVKGDEDYRHWAQGAKAGLFVGLLIGAGEAFFLALGLQKKLSTSLLGPLERIGAMLSSMGLALFLDASACIIVGSLLALFVFLGIRKKVEAMNLPAFYLSSTLALSLTVLFSIHLHRGWLPRSTPISQPLIIAIIAGLVLFCAATLFISYAGLKRLNDWKKAWVLLAILVMHAVSIPLGLFALKDGYGSRSTLGALKGASASTNLSEVQAKKSHSVMLITMDTTRADHLSCYGYSKETSPNVDSLAQEALLFKNCISSASWTLPAHASIFTGLSPSEHGAHNGHQNMPFGLGPLNQKYLTLAEILKEERYTTAAITGGPALDSGFGLNQGFDFYDDRLNRPLKPLALFKLVAEFRPLLLVPRARSYAEEINQLVLPWLKRHYEEPLFLFINYFDPIEVEIAPAI